MLELFMKYPIDTVVVFNGTEYWITGYELYSDKRYLICRYGDAECRLNVERADINGY